jgi:YfiR/HmsC-like
MPVLRTAPGRHSRRWSIPFALVLLCVLTAGLSTRNAQAQGQPDEYQVKAAYLLNFARFVEWPSDVLPAGSPLTIAVIGNDPFAGTLENLMRGNPANGHPIRVRYLRWNDSLVQCQIVYISTSEEAHLPEILRLMGSESVLTVSDMDRFSLRGGVIEFRMVGNRVRFDINRTPATAARIHISSKLLSVARAVREGSAAQ